MARQDSAGATCVGRNVEVQAREERRREGEGEGGRGGERHRMTKDDLDGYG